MITEMLSRALTIIVIGMGVVFSFSLDTLIVWYTDRPTSNTYVPYDFIKGIEQGAGGSNQLEVSSILPFAYTAFDVQ